MPRRLSAGEADLRRPVAVPLEEAFRPQGRDAVEVRLRLVQVELLLADGAEVAGGEIAERLQLGELGVRPVDVAAKRPGMEIPVAVEKVELAEPAPGGSWPS